jgi:hypothetical protein
MQFDAHYADSPDYDQEFVIEEGGRIIGRCGVGFAAQIEDKPVAFDVWLHTEENAPPEVAFLVTEYALNDDGIYHTLNGSGSLVEKIAPGLTLTLSKGSVRLKAAVNTVAYGSQIIDVYARPTLLDRLLGREAEPMTILTPQDYVTSLSMTLTVETRP